MTNFSFKRLEDEMLPVGKTLDVAQPIYGVLTLLPIPGSHWPDAEKAKFLAALGHVLDLVYPTPDSSGESK
jgi:hypothetical protein